MPEANMVSSGYPTWQRGQCAAVNTNPRSPVVSGMRAVLLLACAAAAAAAAAETAPADAALSAPPSATVFSSVELEVTPPAALAALPDDQVHDAYDADRDGTWIRGQVRFACAGAAPVDVPIFAMRPSPDAPWVWRARWMPMRPGTWTASLAIEGAVRGSRIAASAPGLTIAVAVGPPLTGPLLAPGPDDDPRWLREANADGGSRACWVFGACRAWVVASDPAAGGWSACEGIDRERDLFPALRENGYDLLNQWMAPWEYLLVHRDRAEFWRGPDGRWTRHELGADRPYDSAAAYDQGRAADFDALVRSCEGDARKPTVRLLLSLLPHQVFQVGGWSPEDADGKRPLAQLNGFSAACAGQPPWAFFAADPRQPLDDWRSRLFDREANFLRYAIARWSASRALGMWVLIDELDATGDELGSLSDHTGWWAHPECDRWLGDAVALMRGTLRRADGLRYAGDPFRHPLHCATTSFSERGPSNNIAWDGGGDATRPDTVGWHWYPSWEQGSTWNSAWASAIDGLLAFSRRPGVFPRLVSEYGAPDRATPDDPPSALYPTLYHHALWAAILSGQAGTPMDWDDGKEFGELRARAEPGPFDATHYPLDNGAQLRALRRFLGDLDPATLEPCREPARVVVTGVDAVRAAALTTKAGAVVVHGWLYAPESTGTLRIQGLADGPWRLRWFDPWTADEAGAAVTITAAAGTATIDCAAILARLHGEPFPRRAREDRGRDAAFVLDRP
jgi:hypothetical protein